MEARCSSSSTSSLATTTWAAPRPLEQGLHLHVDRGDVDMGHGGTTTWRCGSSLSRFNLSCPSQCIVPTDCPHICYELYCNLKFWRFRMVWTVQVKCLVLNVTKKCILASCSVLDCARFVLSLFANWWFGIMSVNSWHFVSHFFFVSGMQLCRRFLLSANQATKRMETHENVPRGNICRRLARRQLCQRRQTEPSVIYLLPTAFVLSLSCTNNSNW